MKTDKMEVYNKCFQDFIEQGVLQEITEEELKAWKGGINYVSHHHVSKDSPSTPLRIVINLSLKIMVRLATILLSQRVPIHCPSCTQSW